jgi:uncharacterized membrane protein YedE/YeeE
VRETLGTVATGLLLGFALSRIGFSSWDEVHAMFTFASLRMFLAFALGALVLMFAWPIVVWLQRPRWPSRNVHRGTLVGGVVFGVGWAVSGACPAIALVQLGEGQLGAIWTLAGMVAGNFVYSIVHERYFDWSLASCSDE